LGGGGGGGIGIFECIFVGFGGGGGFFCEKMFVVTIPAIAKAIKYKNNFLIKIF
jgi:hypothetical protein